MNRPLTLVRRPPAARGELLPLMNADHQVEVRVMVPWRVEQELRAQAELLHTSFERFLVLVLTNRAITRGHD